MKTKIYLLFLLQFCSFQMLAGSISGEISYSGTTSGTIYIAAFTSQDLDSDPVYISTLSEPGSFTINDIADGTYYLISILSASMPNILTTDPYGFWGTSDNLLPVVISGNNDVTGINITLIEGTDESPNPFGQKYVEPDAIIALPQETVAGTEPSLVVSGSSIWLYKHDYSGAASAKIFVINPETGSLLDTYYLDLRSSANGISWIDKMVYRNGELWANGGYGDPGGTGWVAGIFKVDVGSNSSSMQKPYSNDFGDNGGLACDGTNLFIKRVDTTSASNDGIVKFNPELVSEVPSALFISQQDAPSHYCFGDNKLWLGYEKINEFDPTTGNFIEGLELPGSAADLFYDGKFWTYDENDNTLKVYYLPTVGIEESKDISEPSTFILSQNYPNPFNPSTTISWYSPIGIRQTLKVYNVLGNEVATLVDEYKAAGNYQVEFNATDLTSGVYFYQIKAGSFVQTQKMILLK